MVLLERLKTNLFRILIHIGALAPLAWILWHYWQGLFVVDAIREMTTLTGKTALILLMLSLVATPINTVFGWKQALRVRRALGLYAFTYAGLHEKRRRMPRPVAGDESAKAAKLRSDES